MDSSSLYDLTSLWWVVDLLRRVRGPKVYTLKRGGHSISARVPFVSGSGVVPLWKSVG